MYSKLIKAKSILVNYIDEVSKLDYDSIEYLIDTIDYLLLGKIPINDEILNIILQDIIVTNCIQKSPNLHKVALIISDIIKENGLCTK